MIELITPRWPAHTGIRACTTTRLGGVSKAPFDSLNLGLHVGDRQADVLCNRTRLQQQLNIDTPLWLTQTHSDVVYCDTGQTPATPPCADASITTAPNRVLAVLTGDCLPILLAHRQKQAVAAIHAGWRGLAKGILQRTLTALPGSPDEYVSWIGPGISQAAYTVSNTFQQTLCALHPRCHTAFVTNEHGIQADLPAIAALLLREHGVHQVHQSALCTYHDVRFFSYRQQHPCGRMATLIWISG